MLKGETVKGEKTRKRKKDRLRHWNISRSSSHNNNNKSVQRALCLCLCCHCHHCCGYCFCLLTIAAAAAAATNDASPAVINEWAMKTCERATSLHYHIKCECDLPETADKDWLSSFSFSSFSGKLKPRNIITMKTPVFLSVSLVIFHRFFLSFSLSLSLSLSLIL